MVSIAALLFKIRDIRQTPLYPIVPWANSCAWSFVFITSRGHPAIEVKRPAPAPASADLLTIGPLGLPFDWLDDVVDGAGEELDTPVEIEGFGSDTADEIGIKEGEVGEVVDVAGGVGGRSPIDVEIYDKEKSPRPVVSPHGSQ